MNWDYIAGFIDGEGSIILKPPRVRIYISNTHKNVLDEIQEFLGCGKIYEINRKKQNKKWSRQYGWTICSHKEVLKILKNLRGRLVVKKDLCKEAINYIETKRWHKYYLSEEELKKWKHLGSSRKIAKKLGVSQFSVLKYLKRYGLFEK